MIQWLLNVWYGKCWHCDTRLDDVPVQVVIKARGKPYTVKVCNDCAEVFDMRALDNEETYHNPF